MLKLEHFFPQQQPEVVVEVAEEEVVVEEVEDQEILNGIIQKLTIRESEDLQNRSQSNVSENAPGFAEAFRGASTDPDLASWAMGIWGGGPQSPEAVQQRLIDENDAIIANLNAAAVADEQNAAFREGVPGNVQSMLNRYSELTGRTLGDDPTTRDIMEFEHEAQDYTAPNLTIAEQEELNAMQEDIQHIINPDMMPPELGHKYRMFEALSGNPSGIFGGFGVNQDMLNEDEEWRRNQQNRNTGNTGANSGVIFETGDDQMGNLEVDPDALDDTGQPLVPVNDPRLVTSSGQPTGQMMAQIIGGAKPPMPAAPTYTIT